MSVMEELSEAAKTATPKLAELLHRAVIEIGELRKDPGAVRLREKHDELIRTNPDYARCYENISFKPDTKLVVQLEVKEQYGTDELLCSLHGKGEKLVAGCQVVNIQLFVEQEQTHEPCVAG